MSPEPLRSADHVDPTNDRARLSRCGRRCQTRRVWEERAHRSCRDITALAAGGLGVGDLHAAALRVVAADIRSELACWATIDPESLLISGMTGGDTALPARYEPLLAEAEYAGHEPHAFADLARRGRPTARLSDLPRRERERSTRLQTVWRPLGIEDEVRVVFVADGSCWGAAGMVRSGPDFSDRELEYLTRVAPVIARATRVSVRSEAAVASSGGAAIVVVGARGELRAMTAAARDWQDRLDDLAPGRFLTMMRIMAAGTRSTAAGGLRSRLRGPDGQWAVLEASSLTGPDEDQVAVSIAPAGTDVQLGMLLSAYGLTAREREVCHEVIGGHSTAVIAERLVISTHTVQDHLKSVFRKVGVRSRGELVAHLRPERPLATTTPGRTAARPRAAMLVRTRSPAIGPATDPRRRAAVAARPAAQEARE